jgi:DNA ligase (NAD+)
MTPKFCPHCGARTERREDSLWCTNEDCTGKLRAELMDLAKWLDIPSLTNAMIRKLTDEEFVLRRPDLFAFCLDLSQMHLKNPAKFNSKMETLGFDPREAINLYQEVMDAAQSRSWDLWLRALGVVQSESQSKQLALALPNLSTLDWLYRDLAGVAQLGLSGLDPEPIVRWCNSHNREDLLGLHEAGCLPLAVKRKATVVDGSGIEGPCSGMVVCITGEHLGMDRKELQEELAKLGATIKNGVSKKLTHLIAGAGAGPSKLQKARELGILVLNTDWLKKTLTDAGVELGVGQGGFEIDVEI